MQLQDWYPATQVAAAAPAAAAPTPNGAAVQASAAVTQSVSGSFSASGHPAAWFLALLAVALVLYHLE